MKFFILASTVLSAMASSVVLSALALWQVIPPSLDRFFDDFPFIAVIVFLWLMSDKRLERMLDVQMEFSKEILGRLDARQEQMSNSIGVLAQQVAMNTASTNEILEKDEVVKQLMDRLGDGR